MRDDHALDPTSEPSRSGTAESTAHLGFPSVAPLELDELLEQLVARAHDVQETQGRLRGLLRAYLTIAGAADLEDVLRHIVSAARELVSARYAALGVVRDGRLVRFLHEGMGADTVSHIAALPEGKGLLGRLVDYPEPLRLADIGSHRSSVGFPEHHPPMHSFLGVPIRIGERVFGNLYLTDKQNAAEFSSDDQELVQALASAAAFAIDNARLLDQVRCSQGWQSALVEITTGLLSGTDSDQALRELVHHARHSARGIGAGIVVPHGADTVVLTVAEGVYDQWHGRPIPREGSIAGVTLSAGSATFVVDPTVSAQTVFVPEASGLIGPTLAVPILGVNGPSGVLCISREPGGEPFDEADQELIGAFASRAELAFGLAASRRDTEQMQLVEDRAQIPEQLREQVISRLFAAGLSVQSMLPPITNPSIQQALSNHIDEIDAIIGDIRTAVFALSDRSDQA